MALLDAELYRLKYELGFNLLNVGAEPYIGVAAIFDQVIQPYLSAGATTTSSTSVTAASSPTPVTLTLASATGVAANATLVVDVDSRQERATVQSITGNDVTVMLSLAHTGTYPVTVEGGESIVRDLLRRLRTIADSLASDAISSAGVKSVDEIEFFGEAGMTRAQHLVSEQSRLRNELASALGLPNMWAKKSRASRRIALY